MLHVSTQYTCRCTPQPNVGHFFYVLLNCDFMYWLAFGGANLAGRSCLGAMGGESWSWAMLRRSSRTTSPHYQPLVTQIHSLHWADLILQNLIKGKWYTGKQKKVISWFQPSRRECQGGRDFGGNFVFSFVEKIVTRHLVTFLWWEAEEAVKGSVYRPRGFELRDREVRNEAVEEVEQCKLHVFCSPAHFNSPSPTRNLFNG